MVLALTERSRFQPVFLLLFFFFWNLWLFLLGFFLCFLPSFCVSFRGRPASELQVSYEAPPPQVSATDWFQVCLRSLHLLCRSTVAWSGWGSEHKLRWR